MNNEQLNDIPRPKDDGSFKLLPKNRIVTGATTKADVDLMVQAVLSIGLPIDHIMALRGKEADDLLDLDGSRHGFLTRLIRKYQHLQGPEQHMLDQAMALVAHDRYIISFFTDGDEELTRDVFEAIKPFTERTVYYCGHFTITYLNFGKNYNQEKAYEASL